MKIETTPAQLFPTTPSKTPLYYNSCSSESTSKSTKNKKLMACSATALTRNRGTEDVGQSRRGSLTFRWEKRSCEHVWTDRNYLKKKKKIIKLVVFFPHNKSCQYI